MRGNTISIRLGRAFIGQTGNLYQYDRGQKLLIEGVDLPEVYQAHFSNAILGRSKPMVGTPEGVDIPDEYLESGMDVHVWIYVSGDDHAETEYHGIIHVTRRAEPTDIQPTPAQATVIDTLVSELNDALEEAQDLAEQIPQDIDAALEEAKESGEFDGPKGDPGDPGPRGAAGAGMVYVDTYSQSGGQTTMLGIAEWQYVYRLGAIVPVVIRTTVPNAANLKLMIGTDTAKTCKVYPLPGSGASLQPGIYFLYCVGNQYQLQLDGFRGKVNGFSVAEAASKAVNTTMPTTPSDSYVPTTKLVAEQLAEKYEKPATGIPASDLADGVIPDPTGLIDDDAGEGDTDKVWSADKSASELSDVNFALNGKADEPTGTKAAGKVYGLDSNLDPVWTTPQSGGGVSDVQVNGVSVVNQGVANVPFASINDAGVVKVRDGGGLKVATDSTNLGKISTDYAGANHIKPGANYYKPIVPAMQDVSVFYGLAKAAGDSTQSASSNAVGTYTENAKSAISEMLTAPETVSGTTPSITAKAGVRYVCGECSTLTIAPPASGDIEVIFDSGSTATVLTITPPTGVTAVKWANGFNPTALNANTTYDIIITDGKLGVAASWT